jgi:omega-amidase
MKVALIQMTIALGDPEANRAKAAERVAKAAEAGAELVLLPELWTTGYCLSRLKDGLAERADGETEAFLARLARAHHLFITSSIPVQEGAGVYNRAILFGPDGARLAIYDKVHLVPMLDEPAWLTAGDHLATAPLGAPTEGVPVAGLGICYDLRFPELWRALALKGAGLFLLPAEWPMVRAPHWRALAIARAIENGAFVLGCNACGSDGTNEFAGGSLIVSPWGEVLAEAGEGEEILLADLDLSQVEAARTRVPVLRDRRPEIYGL